MMTNHIFEHPNEYFHAYVCICELYIPMPYHHIFQYIVGINIHNGPKYPVPRTRAYSPYLKEYMVRIRKVEDILGRSEFGLTDFERYI